MMEIIFLTFLIVKKAYRQKYLECLVLLVGDASKDTSRFTNLVG
jgi:hypothetical protein